MTDESLERVFEMQERRIIRRLNKSSKRVSEARQLANQATVDASSDQLGCRTHATGSRRKNLSEQEGDVE